MGQEVENMGEFPVSQTTPVTDELSKRYKVQDLRFPLEETLASSDTREIANAIRCICQVEGKIVAPSFAAILENLNSYFIKEVNGRTHSLAASTQKSVSALVDGEEPVEKIHARQSHSEFIWPDGSLDPIAVNIEKNFMIQGGYINSVMRDDVEFLEPTEKLIQAMAPIAV